MAAMCLVHLEEESTKREEKEEIKDPDGIYGVTEEFMVCLVQAVKEAQEEEKHCYHCSSPKHFIHDCLLVRTPRENTVKLQGGDGIEEGIPDPSGENNNAQEPPGGGSQGISQPKQTPFLNPDPFQHWASGQKCSQSEDQWGELQGSPGQCKSMHANQYHHT